MIRGSRTAFPVFYLLFYKQNLSITFVVKPSRTKAERLEWSTIAKIRNLTPNVQCVLFGHTEDKSERNENDSTGQPAKYLLHDAGQ